VGPDVGRRGATRHLVCHCLRTAPRLAQRRRGAWNALLQPYPRLPQPHDRLHSDPSRKEGVSRRLNGEGELRPPRTSIAFSLRRNFFSVRRKGLRSTCLQGSPLRKRSLATTSNTPIPRSFPPLRWCGQ